MTEKCTSQDLLGTFYHNSLRGGGGHLRLLDTVLLVEEVEKKHKNIKLNVSDPRIFANFSRIVLMTKFIY